MTVAPVSAASADSASANPLTTLSSNFNNFLQLLMTQLRNQDPSSPMDTNQFTSQLVQFTGVAQQITTNSSLSQLIQLTQAGGIMQSSAMIGKHVAVESDRISLQNGSSSLQFVTRTAQPVAIGVYNNAGVKIQEATLTSTAGSNTWNWNGKDAMGNKMPDGPYKVAVTSGTGTAVPFTVLGTATGVSNQNKTVQLEIGGLSVGFDAVRSVLN